MPDAIMDKPNAMTNKRHLASELLRDLATKLAAQARAAFGVEEEQARRFGEDVAGRVADDWGGQNVYIPMELSGKVKARNEQIYKEFTGDNAAELALKWRLAVQTIYQIIKFERSLRVPRQANLLTE